MSGLVNRLISKEELSLLIKQKNELLNKKEVILKQHPPGSAGYCKNSLKLTPINRRLKELNLKINNEREYFRYQILWECAKKYIPIEKREEFYKEVDQYLGIAEPLLKK